MEKNRKLHILEEASTSIVKLYFITGVDSKLKILYDYDKDTEIYKSGIFFESVKYYSKKSESLTKTYELEDCYDTLIEVGSSSLKDSLRRLDNHSFAEQTWSKIKHFRIYFDSYGLYEIMATDWGAFPETKGKWNIEIQ